MPDILRERRQRRQPHLHAASAPRPQVVRRPAVHGRGFPLLLGRRRATTRTCRRSACRRRCSSASKAPRFEVLNETTVRYTLGRAQSAVPAGARGAEPALHLPARALPAAVPRAATSGSRRPTRRPSEAGSRSWAGLHQKKDEQFRFDNPDLPTLEPWINTTPLPSTRFVLVRNPYFHRVDKPGRQLPYIDRVIVNITDDKLIPAKTGAGDVDLQARYLRFDNYTFLKQSEKRNQLPRAAVGEGARLADRALPESQRRRPRVAQADARRALPPRAVARRSTGTRSTRSSTSASARNRATRCCSGARCSGRSSAPRGRQFDVKAANALLDALGLTKRDAERPAPAARRPADGDHRRHLRREHRGDRRARADPRQLAASSASRSSRGRRSARCSASACSPASR